MSLDRAVAEAVDLISGHDAVTVVSHIDADGIASEAVLVQALSRAGFAVRSVFLRQLEPLMLPQIPLDHGFTIFADMGAGQQSLLAEHGFTAEETLIVDHHVSQDCDTSYPQLNALSHGFHRLSAAGLAYLIARELDLANTDLTKIAVVGNVGDMMAREDGGLTGPAREIAREGEEEGYILSRKDLNIYGISTRPVHMSLAYHDDPDLKRLIRDQSGAMQYLQGLGVGLKDPAGRWLTWEEMNPDDRRTICSSLIQQMIALGAPTDRVIAENYLFPHEAPRTPLRNASEFATLLNACGRWAKPHTGGSICRGDRGQSYREAERMLSNHRSVIRELLSYIVDNGVQELDNLQYIHVGDRFPDTIIGIGAGMALSQQGFRWDKPILIMCTLPEDPAVTKVSMRTHDRVVARGVDLQDALSTASQEVGGAGGGHRIAAGAFIPQAAEEVFVRRVNEILTTQYARTGQGHC